MNFGHFLPPPSPSSRYPCFTPPDFFVNFGPTLLFQLLEALFWLKRRPTILNFYPTRNFGHFWAALSKMSLNFSKFLGRFRRHTQCPFSLVSSSVSSSCLLLWPWLRSLSHGGPCSLHVVLGLAWLPLPMVTGFFEIAQSWNTEQSRKRRKQNTEENQDEQK